MSSLNELISSESEIVLYLGKFLGKQQGKLVFSFNYIRNRTTVQFAWFREKDICGFLNGCVACESAGRLTAVCSCLSVLTLDAVSKVRWLIPVRKWKGTWSALLIMPNNPVNSLHLRGPWGCTLLFVVNLQRYNYFDYKCPLCEDIRKDFCHL